MRPAFAKFFLIMFALGSWGCATSYTIKTKPAGARVMAGTKELGKTPVTFSDDQVSDRQADGVLVRVENDGYKALWLWLPAGQYTYEINLNLSPFYQRVTTDGTINDQEISRADLNRVTDRLLNLQTALLLGQPMPKEDLKRISDANPTLGSAHFLNALELLKAGKKDEARVRLREAMRFSPGESDFLLLYNELGGDKP